MDYQAKFVGCMVREAGQGADSPSQSQHWLIRWTSYLLLSADPCLFSMHWKIYSETSERANSRCSRIGSRALAVPPQGANRSCLEMQQQQQQHLEVIKLPTNLDVQCYSCGKKQNQHWWENIARIVILFHEIAFLQMHCVKRNIEMKRKITSCSRHKNLFCSNLDTKWQNENEDYEDSYSVLPQTVFSFCE